MSVKDEKEIVDAFRRLKSFHDQLCGLAQLVGDVDGVWTEQAEIVELVKRDPRICQVGMVGPEDFFMIENSTVKYGKLHEIFSWQGDLIIYNLLQERLGEVVYLLCASGVDFVEAVRDFRDKKKRRWEGR